MRLLCERFPETNLANGDPTISRLTYLPAYKHTNANIASLFGGG